MSYDEQYAVVYALVRELDSIKEILYTVSERIRETGVLVGGYFVPDTPEQIQKGLGNLGEASKRIGELWVDVDTARNEFEEWVSRKFRA